MKKKSIKKIETKLDKILDMASPKIDVEISRHFKSSKKVSNKFQKLILNLINYPNGISIELNKSKKFIKIYIESISIIKNIDLHPLQTSNNSLINSSEENLQINVDSFGFSINYGYSIQSKYKDKNMYNYLLPIVRKTQSEKNENNFNYILTEIFKKSGIIRDSNLDEILN
jgi:hypothetical protein